VPDDASQDAPPLVIALLGWLREYAASHRDERGMGLSFPPGFTATMQSALFEAAQEHGHDFWNEQVPFAAPGWRVDDLILPEVKINLPSVIPPPMEVEDFAFTVKKHGVAGLTPVQLLLLVLVWLMLMGEPAIEAAFPPAVQQALATEAGTISLAIALTTIILKRKDGGSDKKD
jgi:hypothetical protein